MSALLPFTSLHLTSRAFTLIKSMCRSEIDVGPSAPAAVGRVGDHKRKRGKLAGFRAWKQQELRNRLGLFQLMVSEIVGARRKGCVDFLQSLEWLEVEGPELLDKRSLFLGA